MLYPRFGRPRRRPVYRPYVLALVSGVALALCFPTADFSALAWAALVPFLASVWDLPPSRAFKAGFLLGLPYFFGTQYWIYHSMNHYGGVSFGASMGVVFLLAAYESIYLGLFGAAFSHSVRNTSLPALLLAPLYWVVCEFVRSYAFTGFPWSSIGYTQYKFLPAIQFADITGVYGVSFLVVAINGALADYFISRKKRHEQPISNLWPTAAGLGALAFVCVLVLGYGFYRLHQQRPGQYVAVSVVQGAIEQDVKWDPAYQRATLDTYKSLSSTAVEAGTGLVVWPETAAPFYWEKDAAHTFELKEFAALAGTEMLFGVVTQKGELEYSNSAVLLDANGEARYIYDKIHLVPFGEYVPLEPVLGMFVNRVVGGIGQYVPGKKYEQAEAKVGKFGALICYEIIFPGLVRKFYRQGGDLMVNITNDGWFGLTTGPYQHFSMGALRAVENRKPLVRAANTGISGFFDSNGRVMQSIPLFQRGALTETIKTDTTRTFYTRYGDLFSYLCMVVAVVLLAGIGRRH